MNEFITIFAGSLGLLTDPFMWLLILIGIAYGVVVGALPGVGATLGYGLVLPFTFLVAPQYAVGFLCSIAVGNQYGNSLPAILIAVPGSSAAVLTVMDGYAMNRRGEAGLALGIQFVSAIVGQFLSIPIFVLAVVPLSNLAYVFLPPELFALYLLGIVTIVSLTGKSVVKGLLAASLGMLVGVVGLDPIQAQPRLTFGQADLRNGLDTAAVIIGILACSELFRSTRQVFNWTEVIETVSAKFPSWSKIRPTIPAMLIGTAVGTFISAIPGAGATTGAMISYQQAKLVSKHPELFGKGAPDGLAANEAAQNASNSGELIPTLGLGIPGSGSMVLLLGALTFQGLVPGPNLIKETPTLLFAAVAGLLGGTIVLVFTGWWMCGVMYRLVTINRQVVTITSLLLVVLGTFSLHGRIFDVFVCLGFGVVGYFMRRYGYSTAAAALAVVLSAGLETNLRQGMELFDNNIFRFVGRPVTAFMLTVCLLVLIYGIWAEVKLRRSQTPAGTEPDDPAP